MPERDPIFRPVDKEEHKKFYREKAIVIKIMPRTLERILYVLIIVILGGIFLFSRGCSFDFGGEEKNETVAPVQAAPEPEPEPTPEETPEETPVEEPPEPEEPEPVVEGIDTEGVSVAIDVNYERITNTTAFKVNYIDLTIVNGNTRVIPRVELYWYDSASNELRKTYVRGTVDYLQGLEPGQTWKRTIKESELNSKYFESGEPESETFIAKIYDRSTGSLLKTGQKVYTNLE